VLVEAIVFAVLVVLAAGSRLIDHAPNFVAVAAVAMFAGYFFRSRVLALGAPLVAMAISDVAIGFYNPTVMATVYAAMLCSVAMGRVIASRNGALGRRAAWIAGGTVGGSALFFVTTNFAVWAASGYYTLDLAGFERCYIAALPFVKYTIASDAIFAGGLFGVHAAVGGLMASRFPVLRLARTA
jgi:hypothetical protein